MIVSEFLAQSRRLKTPERVTSRERQSDNKARRSRSRTRRDSVSRKRQSRLYVGRSSRDFDKLREMEQEVNGERERLLDLQDVLYMERSHIRRTVSHQREDEEGWYS